MKTYTVRETAELLNVGMRSVQKRCVRYGVEKTDEGFMIPQSVIDEWQKKNEQKANVHRQQGERVDALEKQVENLTSELERYQQVVIQHQKLIRLITQRLNQLPTEIEQIEQTELQEPEENALGVVRNQETNNYPENNEKRPSMNDPSFTSNYDPNWNKDI